MNYPKVSIIILNWNGWEDTIECLESLYQITHPNYEVIVVDNGSEDESVEKIKEYTAGKIKVESKFFRYDPSNKPIKIVEYTREEAESGGGKEKEIIDLPSNKKLIIIKNERNYGFAEGNNIAMRYALKALDPSYILLLNNDTVVDPEFLSELIKVAKNNEEIGIVGPKIYYYDFNGRTDIIQSAGGKISPWRETIYSHIRPEENQEQYESIKEVDWISGCAFMLKSIVIKKLSLLNSEYFFGNEDVEYCIKARYHGIKVILVPTSKVWHKVGVSRAKTGAKIMDISAHFRFIKRNFSGIIYAYHILLFLIITLPKWAIIYLFKYRDKNTFYAFILNIKKFILRK